MNLTALGTRHMPWLKCVQCESRIEKTEVEFVNRIGYKVRPHEVAPTRRGVRVVDGA